MDAVEQILGDNAALLGRDDEVASAMRPAAQPHDAGILGNPVVGPVGVGHPVREAPAECGARTRVVIRVVAINRKPQYTAEFPATTTADVEEGLVATHPGPQRPPAIQGWQRRLVHMDEGAGQHLGADRLGDGGHERREPAGQVRELRVRQV